MKGWEVKWSTPIPQILKLLPPNIKMLLKCISGAAESLRISIFGSSVHRVCIFFYISFLYTSQVRSQGGFEGVRTNKKPEPGPQSDWTRRSCFFSYNAPYKHIPTDTGAISLRTSRWRWHSQVTWSHDCKFHSTTPNTSLGMWRICSKLPKLSQVWSRIEYLLEYYSNHSD